MRLEANTASPRPLILLVDDNHDGILARRSVLEELGYEVAPASSGLEALEKLQARRFDLLITDFKMAPIDGLELIRRVRADGNTIPIILLSGFAETIGLTPESTGANAVLQKSAKEIDMLVRNAKRLLNPPRKPASKQQKPAAYKTKRNG